MGRGYVALYLMIGAVILSAPIWYHIIALASIAPARISTTNPEIAIENLNSQILSAEKLIGLHPERFELKKQLYKLLVTRAQYFGSYDDFKRLRELTSYIPTNVEEYLLKAKFLIVVHEFSDAEKMLSEISRLAPENREVTRQMLPIRLARRDNLAELQKTQTEEVKQNPSYGNLVLLSGIESELGNFDQADRHLERAIQSYRDSSPFPIAYLYFQRGLLWSEKAGDANRGKLYYSEAVHYLPQFVIGEVHLAELERAAGNTDNAIARLMLVASSKDPEARGKLSELLREKGSIQQAASYLDSSLNDYNYLLANYPFAFADHGAEFFAGPGANPNRALELARMNLSNRKSERAYLVAINAALAADAANTPDAKKTLCELISEAQLLKPVFVPLKELIQNAPIECRASR